MAVNSCKQYQQLSQVQIIYTFNHVPTSKPNQRKITAYDSLR